MNWYLQVLQKYATFNGRARRSEFWMFTLLSVIATFALATVEVLILDNAGVTDQVESSVLVTLYSLAVFIPTLAVTARRLHDTGRSGWWMLIPIIPLVGGIALIVFLAQDGHGGENQYGTNPKAIETT